MLTALLFFWLIFSPAQVFADVSNRFTIEPNPTFTGNTGNPGLNVKAKLAISESDPSPSIEEGVEIRISNARDGDSCNVQGGEYHTDADGYIYATCTATTSGVVKIYAYSLDYADQSSETSLIFNSSPTPIVNTPAPVSPTNAPPADSPAPTSSTASTNAPTSTATPTPKTTSKQTAGSQASGFGGGGLVDEKDVLETGLGTDNGQTLGTATQDIDSSGDKDLLSTLIFLTAAVVLLVWTVYMILVQKGIIKSESKKATHKKNFTPLPPRSP